MTIATDQGDAWVGDSAALRVALDLISRFALTSATALILGETGTGKELAARRMHYHGPRAARPFIAVNCGALPDALLESELFGHARGAFTDAREARSGLVALADGGTLFLDEVEALSSRAQVVLLRFLQDRSYRPVGGGAERTTNVRVVAASNQDLLDLARRGSFREDLVYRLAVMTLTLPPLRERGADVELLAEHFLARLSRQYGVPPKLLSGDTRRRLRAYAWPGNVRELENLVHRQFVLADGEDLVIELPDAVAPTVTSPAPDDAAAPLLSFGDAKQLAINAFERSFLTDALHACGGNVSQAARRIGKERRALGKLLKKHGLDGHSFRRAPCI